MTYIPPADRITLAEKHGLDDALRIITLIEQAGVTSSFTDRYSTAMALHIAKEQGFYPEVLAGIMAARRDRLTYLTRQQRNWQTKVSHRPQRGRHHDSWTIREKYMRKAS